MSTSSTKRLIKKATGNKRILAAVIVGCVLLISTLFLAKENLFTYVKYQSHSADLKKEIKEWQKEFVRDSTRLEELKMNSNNLERLAREELLMQHDNELVFIIKD